MSTRRRETTLRDMLSCSCLSPLSWQSSDNGSGDESFTPIKGIRRSAEASRSAASPLTGPGVGRQVATQKLMRPYSAVLDHQGSLPLDPQQPPPPLGLPTTCTAARSAAVDLLVHHGTSLSAEHDNVQPPQPASCCMASTCKPNSTSVDSADTVFHSATTNMRPAADGGFDTSGPAASSYTSSRRAASLSTGAPPLDSEQSTSDSNIHRHSALLMVGKGMSGTHKISLGALQQLVPRGRPGRGSSCGGGHDAISVRAAISASLAHHIGAAPAAASSFAFAARSGPVRKGPAASAAPSMALAHLSMARWANLLLPSSPASFPAMASASAFPALSPTIMISSRPSTEVDPGRNGAQQRRLSDSAAGLADASLPVGAAAYIMRNKGQGVEVGNPLATQDFDILGSATSSRSGGGSVNGAAGWYSRGISIGPSCSCLIPVYDELLVITNNR